MAGKMQSVPAIGNYFGTLNPLAEKIQADIIDIGSAYANLWNTFSKDEQNELIDVTLIKPNLILKYVDEMKNDRNLKKRRSSAMLSKDDATIITDTDSNNDRLSISSSSNSNSYRSNDFSHIYLYNGKDLCTYGQIITALRYNQDDLCGVYRDEHSEPFNSKTKSQMNLNFSNTQYERAQKKFPEIKPAIAGLDAVDGVVKKGMVDHMMPELRAKLASLNNGGGAGGGGGFSVEHSQTDGASSVVWVFASLLLLNLRNEQKNIETSSCFCLFELIFRRKSFMTRLFSGKSNAMNVPSPRAAATAAAAAGAASPSLAKKKAAPLDLSSINLGIVTASSNFDSMSTKSATSSKPEEITNDMSRLIDINDNDDDEDDDGANDILNETADYDFLNNW